MNPQLTSNSRSYWLIIGVLLLAAGARILGAGSFPVWTDEGWSIHAASSHQVDTILSIVAEDRHPPLYFLSLSAWSSLAGDSRLALRVLSIAGGMLTVAITYRLTADSFGRRAGLLAALLLAALPSAVYYAQEVRHYGWLTLFAALSWHCFLRCLRQPTRARWIAYALSLALMLYTHYFGVLALAVQAFVGLILWRVPARRKRPLVVAWAGAALLVSPWLIVIATRQAGILGSGIAGFPGTIAPTLDNLVPIVTLVFGDQLALMLGLYVLGAWAVLRRRAQPQAWTVIRRGALPARLRPHGTTIRRAVLLGGGGLFAAMLLLSQRFDFLSARTLVFLTPLLMAVCGCGLALLDRRASLVLAASFVVVSLAGRPVVQARLNSDIAAQVVGAQASPGDLVILETGWDDNAFAYEFGRTLPDGVDIIRTLPWTNDRTGGDPVVPQIEDALEAHARVWVVQWLQAPQVMPFLERGGLGFRPSLAFESPSGEYGQRFGDDTIRARLYERPQTDDAPIVYGDLLALHDALFTANARVGDPLHVDLWWTALAPLTRDYSVGVYLLDENGINRAEHNAAPTPATTTWKTDNLIFDRHTLALPPDLPAGIYRLAVSAYWYANPTPLTVDGEPYALVGAVIVQSE